MEGVFFECVDHIFAVCKFSLFEVYCIAERMPRMRSESSETFRKEIFSVFFVF